MFEIIRPERDAIDIEKSLPIGTAAEGMSFCGLDFEFSKRLASIRRERVRSMSRAEVVELYHTDDIFEELSEGLSWNEAFNRLDFVDYQRLEVRAAETLVSRFGETALAALDDDSQGSPLEIGFPSGQGLRHRYGFASAIVACHPTMLMNKPAIRLISKISTPVEVSELYMKKGNRYTEKNTIRYGSSEENSVRAVGLFDEYAFLRTSSGRVEKTKREAVGQNSHYDAQHPHRIGLSIKNPASKELSDQSWSDELSLAIVSSFNSG